MNEKDMVVGNYEIKDLEPFVNPETKKRHRAMWTFVNGRQFVAQYEETGDLLRDTQLRENCRQDIDWFIRGFWFFGCGGYDHDFPDGGVDVDKEYTCRTCGAKKKKNMDLPAVLRAARAEDANRAKGIVH